MGSFDSLLIEAMTGEGFRVVDRFDNNSYAPVFYLQLTADQPLRFPPGHESLHSSENSIFHCCSVPCEPQPIVVPTLYSCVSHTLPVCSNRIHSAVILPVARLRLHTGMTTACSFKNTRSALMAAAGGLFT